MKKKIFVVMVVAAGLVVSALNVQAARWNDDPSSDPVYQQFLEDTSDIRKEIAMDQAELNAMLAGENPDTYKARELSARISDNKQKLAELASANGFGPGNRGGCGGPRYGRGGCGSGCAGPVNNTTGTPATCGSPSCPNAVQAQ